MEVEINDNTDFDASVPLLVKKSIVMSCLIKNVFVNAKPLIGKEAEVLEKTYKRLASKTPTKL